MTQFVQNGVLVELLQGGQIFDVHALRRHFEALDESTAHGHLVAFDQTCHFGDELDEMLDLAGELYKQNCYGVA